MPQARLVGWERSLYWDDALAAPLPLGTVAGRVLLHHEAAAVFTPQLVADVYGNRVDAAVLAGDGRYVEADGYWWERQAIHHYGGADSFFELASEEALDGGTTTFVPDAHALAVELTTDALGNQVRRELDYHTLRVARVTDPNGNVEEAQLDALGSPVVAVARGHAVGTAGEQSYGGDPLT